MCIWRTSHRRKMFIRLISFDWFQVNKQGCIVLPESVTTGPIEYLGRHGSVRDILLLKICPFTICSCRQTQPIIAFKATCCENLLLAFFMLFFSDFLFIVLFFYHFYLHFFYPRLLNVQQRLPQKPSLLSTEVKEEQFFSIWWFYLWGLQEGVLMLLFGYCIILYCALLLHLLTIKITY